MFDRLPRRPTMNRSLRVLAVNAVALALFWGLGFAVVQLARRLSGGWLSGEVGLVVTCCVGLAVALRLGAKGAAVLIGGQLAFTAAELVAHAAYGVRAVQGGPVHLTVMGAATLGLLLGLWLSPWLARADSSTAPALPAVRNDGNGFGSKEETAGSRETPLGPSLAA